MPNSSPKRAAKVATNTRLSPDVKAAQIASGLSIDALLRDALARRGAGALQSSPGPTLTPVQVIRALRWTGRLRPETIVAGVRAGAGDPTLAEQWPELSMDEVDTLRATSAEMTANRLRQWMRSEGRQPTWLEVRALITGLHHVLE